MALAWCTEHGTNWNQRCPACQDAEAVGGLEETIHKLMAENAGLKAALENASARGDKYCEENAKLRAVVDAARKLRDDGHLDWNFAPDLELERTLSQLEASCICNGTRICMLHTEKALDAK